MNVREFLQQHDIVYEVLEHQATYDAQRLAHAVHVSGKEVAKTVLLRVDDGYALAILPATRSVDVSRVKEAIDAEMVARIRFSESPVARFIWPTRRCSLRFNETIRRSVTRGVDRD